MSSAPLFDEGGEDGGAVVARQHILEGLSSEGELHGCFVAIALVVLEQPVQRDDVAAPRTACEM